MSLVAKTAIEAAPLDDGMILFHPDTGNFAVLNTTATHIWDQLNIPSTEEQLAGFLCARFAVAETVARDDAHHMLGQLIELSLVESIEGSVSTSTPKVDTDRNEEESRVQVAHRTESYESPTITVLSDTELLNAFQMTAAEISAAGCWWMPTSAHP
jgi:hypothetical protein